MNSKKRIVFVTTELYPFTGGGIGKFTFNALKTFNSEEIRRVTVLLTHGKIANEAFELTFPGAQLLQLADWKESTDEAEFVSNSRDEWFSISVRIMLMLRKLAEREAIGYVEFPDWSGLGFATLQEKRLRGFLWNATIAVRIHSTEAILVLVESRELRAEDLRRYDLERKCLRDCDVIAAHLAIIAETTRRHFGFGEEEWVPRLHIAEPPVDLLGRAPKQRSIIPGPNTSIAFTSKFQEFKRPEIFVQGMIQFLASNPDFKGNAVLLCGGLELEFAEKILSSIPEQHKARFKKFGNVSQMERDELIASSIVVFPTIYESFCLAAHEASQLGAIVVLNEKNPAFGSETPWIDQVNCIKFDGTALGMSGALSSCLGRPKDLAAVVPKVEVQAWQTDCRFNGESWHSLENEPLVSVIVVNQNNGTMLGATLRSVSLQDYSNLKLIVVDDGSSDPASQLTMQSLAKTGQDGVKTIHLAAPLGRSAAKNHAMDSVSGDYVMVVESGDIVWKGQIRDAVTCLENNDQFEMVVSQAAYYQDNENLPLSELRIETFVGEAPVSGTVLNYYSTGGWLCRSKLAKSAAYRPEVGYLDNWAWMMNAVALGKRVVASPRIGILVQERHERNQGTPIDEPGRLHHLMVSGASTVLPHFPVSALARLTRGHASLQAVPAWYQHMVENSYEEEVEFMAQMLGHTWIGKTARNNRAVSNLLEKLIRTVARMR